MDMKGYIKISCLDNFSWICPQFISCFSKDILLYPSVSMCILSYLKISSGANSQMDIRYLAGCGLEWQEVTEETGEIAADAGEGGTAGEEGTEEVQEAGGKGEGGRHTDCSPSPIPPVDPYDDFAKWAMLNAETIPFGSMKFAWDITFTSNRAYHVSYFT